MNKIPECPSLPAPAGKRGLLSWQWRSWSRLLTLVYMILGAALFSAYIYWNTALIIIGALVLFIYPEGRRPSLQPLRSGWLAFVFFLAYLVIPCRSLLYMAMGGSIIFFRESFYGRTERISWFVLLLVSPVAEYLMNMFSFPIRLQLTGWAGSLIRYTGIPVQTEGNLLICKGNSFYIDPACMGLHMLSFSLLSGLLLVRCFQARFQRILGVVPVLLILLTAIALNILSNLMRIYCLSILCILPENRLHSIVGLICMAVYVLLPITCLTRWMVRRYGKAALIRVAFPLRSISSRRKLLAANLVLSGCMLTGVILGWARKYSPGGVLQLGNDKALIYIKPIASFYSADHLPAICWQGSGYDFLQVKEENIGGQTLFTGILQHSAAGRQSTAITQNQPVRNKNQPARNQEAGQLYTAWWYDNGSRRTTSQVGWRWDMFRGGKRYALINITTASREDLEKELRSVLEAGSLNEPIRKGCLF